MAPTNAAGKTFHIRDSYGYLLTSVDGLEVGLQMGFAVIHVDGDGCLSIWVPVTADGCSDVCLCRVLVALGVLVWFPS